jgi:RimJ/RimL family protein N-acetyltransferase
MIPLALESALTRLGRLIPSDITRVYCLSSRNRVAVGRDCAGYDFRFVDAKVLTTAVSEPNLELSDHHVDLAKSAEARCFAALRGADICAYAWFAEQEVAPRHNTGGTGFAGIGLSLGSGITYAFKCLVAQKHRGNALMSHLLFHASVSLETEGLTRVITTTDISNRAFQRTVERIGFEHVDHAAEFVILGRHFYRLPRHAEHVRFHVGRAA